MIDATFAFQRPRHVATPAPGTVEPGVIFEVFFVVPDRIGRLT
jgi:hypothetical protein